MHLPSMKWIPDEVKQKLRIQYKNQINKEDTLVIHSQEKRDQDQNKNQAIERLREMLFQCSKPEKKEFMVAEKSEFKKEKD